MNDNPQPLPSLEITPSPRLSFALQQGWEAFHAAIVAVGATTFTKWFTHRSGDADLAETVSLLVADYLDPEMDDADRLEALASLAEIGEETEDDLLADTLWEGVVSTAIDAGDGDAVAEATSRLAAIAERYGDFLAAAEHRITFLNWRRTDGASSDPEAVHEAFEAIVRLAELDGAQRARAEWAFRQAAFTRLAEAEDDRAVFGDWEANPTPYAGWE